jgi:type II secretory pathway predicted ATPase ExeA
MEQRMRSASGFASHLAMKVWLRPLTQEDTKNYVLYRLKAAGCQRGLFTRQAADAIFQYTGGFPRNINRLCELSLTIACGLQAKKIGPEIIETAAENLGLESDILDALGQTGAGCGEADILSSIPA